MLRELKVYNDIEWAEELDELDDRPWGGFSWGSGSLSSLTALTSLTLSPGAVLPGEQCCTLPLCEQTAGCLVQFCTARWLVPAMFGLALRPALACSILMSMFLSRCADPASLATAPNLASVFEGPPHPNSTMYLRIIWQRRINDWVKALHRLRPEIRAR